MVRRLVEQEQIGLEHEQAREMRAHNPAATECARRPVEIRFAKREPGQNLLRLRLDLPIVLRFQFRVGFAAGEFEHRLPARGCGFLREIPERDVFLQRHFSRVRRSLAEQKGEKR